MGHPLAVKGLVMKRHQIIIPQVLQGDILAKLHASHQGTEKSKLRARTSAFWKNLRKDIEEMTKSCKVCQELKPNKPREPLLQTELPPRPWHTTLFCLDEDEYLLIADYYGPSTRLSGKYQRARAPVNVLWT